MSLRCGIHGDWFKFERTFQWCIGLKHAMNLFGGLMNWSLPFFSSGHSRSPVKWSYSKISHGSSLICHLCPPFPPSKHIQKFLFFFYNSLIYFKIRLHLNFFSLRKRNSKKIFTVMRNATWESLSPLLLPSRTLSFPGSTFNRLWKNHFIPNFIIYFNYLKLCYLVWFSLKS